MTQTIRVKLKKRIDDSYQISVGAGSVRQLPQLIEKFPGISRTVIISDSRVVKLWGKAVISLLRASKKRAVLFTFPAGEKYKNQDTVSSLQSKMFAAGCGRDTLIIALGGGVVGDVAGFVAATFMRGVPFVQVPTTLLAMVDSSIGGKAGIDNKFGKNLVGAFWQPKAVLVDPDFLRTLPKRHLVSGLAEAIKIFLTCDAEMFALVEKNLGKILAGDQVMLGKIISHSLALKAGVVGRDEKEKGERMILNFGHTVGHALEKLSGYKLLHGEAVALGIMSECKIAQILGILNYAAAERVEKVIRGLKINESTVKKYSAREMIKIMRFDKKGKNNFVLPKGIGAVYVNKGRYAHTVDKRIIKGVL